MVREISMQMIFTWTNGLPSFGTCNRLDALAGHVVQGDVDQERDQLHLDGHGVQENDFLYLSSGQIAAELPTWDQMFHRKTTFWEEAKLTGSSSSSPEEECFLLVAHPASSPSPLLHLWRNEINKKNSIAPQSKKATQKDEKWKAKKNDAPQNRRRTCGKTDEAAPPFLLFLSLLFLFLLLLLRFATVYRHLLLLAQRLSEFHKKAKVEALVEILAHLVENEPVPDRTSPDEVFHIIAVRTCVKVEAHLEEEEEEAEVWVE